MNSSSTLSTYLGRPLEYSSCNWDRPQPAYWRSLATGATRTKCYQRTQIQPYRGHSLKPGNHLDRTSSAWLQSGSDHMAETHSCTKLEVRNPCNPKTRISSAYCSSIPHEPRAKPGVSLDWHKPADLWGKACIARHQRIVHTLGA